MSPDLVIVGGGLAGSAAARQLALAGRRVVLVERQPGPHHKVCGEFLSFEAQQSFEMLGLDMQAPEFRSLGAQRIRQVRLIWGRRQAESELPFPAWGLSRFELDEWLLHQAAAAGVEVRRGEAVRRIRADGSGVRVAVGSAELPAAAAVLATGKHDLRDRGRAVSPSRTIGLKIHARLSPSHARALAESVEVVPFDGGYAGLLNVESGISNICVLVTKERYAELGRSWRQLVSSVPHLARRLEGAESCWTQPLAMSGIPAGYLHREPTADPVYRVGDQVATIPPFAGDGMAMALGSARIVAGGLSNGWSSDACHRAVAERFLLPTGLARLVSFLGSAPLLRPALMQAFALFPGLMSIVAQRTRSSLALAREADSTAAA